MNSSSRFHAKRFGNRSQKCSMFWYQITKMLNVLVPDHKKQTSRIIKSKSSFNSHALSLTFNSHALSPTLKNIKLTAD